LRDPQAGGSVLQDWPHDQAAEKPGTELASPNPLCCLDFR